MIPATHTIRCAVYGSLRRTMGNYRLLDNPGALYIGDGWLEGYDMLDLGSFPGIIPGDGRVLCEMFAVTPGVLARLDQLEGHPSFYRRTPVTLVDSDGKPHPVEVYVLQRVGGHLSIVEGGDWVKHLAARGSRRPSFA